MKSLSSWLLVAFMVMFWLFRIFAVIMTEFTGSFAGMEPLNVQLEIALIFITLLCVLLVVKRKLFGGLIYLVSYALYFGVFIFNNIAILLQGQMLQLNNFMALFISIIGMIIPLAVTIDLLVDRNRMKHPVDEKTDWFFKNEQYDRKYDERADRNNYRTM